MEAAVVTFSDIQMFTGFAILLSGYIQLPSGISTYHWQVIVSLAWFSSITHLATLTFLRDYLLTHRGMAKFRTIFMGVVVVLLAVALIPMGYIPSVRHIGTPAICMFSKKGRLEASGDFVGFFDYNFPFVFLSMGFLIPIYIWRVTNLFRKTSPRECFETNIGNLLRKGYEIAEHQRRKTTTFIPINLSGKIFKAISLLAYTLSKAFYEMLDSRLWQVRIFRDNFVHRS